MKRGLALIEILLVVGILAVLVTLTLPLTLDFYKSQQLNIHTQGVIQALRRAQLKAMSVENSSIFGVYLVDDNYTLFKGSSYATRDVQYDAVSDLPQIINISGLSEIVFSKFEGIPSATGTIILSNNGDSQTISINEIGRINLE
ncbi:MAG: Tfp pilus assembly protein FimT/FimU [Candidatus Paceibacterales bacterium]